MSQLDDEVTVVVTNKPDSELYAVFEESNFDVNVGESAALQVNEGIQYIQSGKKEIGEAVAEVQAEIIALATQKTAEFDENAEQKTNNFNDNATDKTQTFNTNATGKTNAYNQNASSLTANFNNNANAQTITFNQNASDKTTAFNTNYAEKKALIDAEVQTAETAATNASNSADLAKQWAVGIPSEPTGYSAKHWAEEAASELSSINAKIPAEASASNQLADKAYVDAEDNSLQSQIDALVVASDVYDIVGTYAELQAYDISTVPVNDIIKVLVDSTHSNAATYYRCVETGGVKSWSYIGSEGAYYTKAETNTLLNAKQDTLVSGTNIKTVNGNSLLGSGDVNISAVASWGNITGTLSNQTDLNNALSGKANVGLDNLNSTGQMIIDSQNGTISNCILEIPQNIKLEINTDNNRINIASGSTLVIPNGDTYTTSQTTTYPSNYTTKVGNSPSNKYLVLFWLTGSGCEVIPIEACYSGTTQPTTTYLRGYWYNTTDRYLYKTSNTGETWEKLQRVWSFPVCVVEEDSNNKWQFVKDSNGNDMIFNGAGFIGHHAFVYPNVNGLIPKGFNDEGTLKSTNKLNNQLLIIELQQGFSTLFLNTYSSGANVNIYSGEVETNDDLPLTNVFYYVKSRNFISRKNGFGVLSEGNNIVPFIEYTYDGTTVTDFTIRQPYEGARNLLTDDIEKQVEQNTADIATKANISSLSTVATSGSYNDLSDKPTIPTVNNATLTIQKNGTTVKTFTANASTNVTANITVPTKTSDITNDSGYITGISSSDVTTALGYTPANDSNVVHRTGNEEISGIKTFNGVDVKYKRGGSDLTTQATSAENWVGPRFVDKNDKQGGLLQYRRLSSGISETNIQTRALSTNSFSKIAIYQNPDGTEYTEAPTPDSGDNSTKIATTAYVKAQGYALDNAVVKTSGDQTVGGKKTFTSQVTKTNSLAAADTIFVNKNKAITKGTAPSANVESRWRLTDSSTGDSNSALIGGVVFGYSTNMRTSAVLQVGKPEAGSTSTASLGIYYPATGDPCTEAPTPATSDNSTKIATTEWVNGKIETNLSVNMSNRVSVSESTITSGYTAPNNGFIYVSGANTSNSAISFLIDNNYVGYNGYQNTPLTQCNTFYLSKGNVFKISRAFSSSFNAYFVPLG